MGARPRRLELAGEASLDVRLHLGAEVSYDLVILDVMLPGLDGWQVLKTWRANGRHMPVLLLTAKDQVEDRVKGLELGADDYLVKPFSFAELLARVRTVLSTDDVASAPIDQRHKRRGVAGNFFIFAGLNLAGGLLAYLTLTRATPMPRPIQRTLSTRLN